MSSDSSPFVARVLQAMLNGNSAATGISLAFPEDLANSTAGGSNGTAANDQTIWNIEDGKSPGFFLIICIFVAVTALPFGCFWFLRHKRRSVQPFDLANNANMMAQATAISGGRSVQTPTISKEEIANRRDKLNERFEQGEVQKVIQEHDFEADGHGDEEEAMSELRESLSNDDGVASPAQLDSLRSQEDSTRILSKQNVRLTPTRTVPNGCAICLAQYRPGEVVVWSSNSTCCHAFHKDCMLDWLVKVPAGGSTLCPCCRQEFIDLS